ncbi:putative phosphoketolase [Lasiodiplodia hormozganensis]|uniref:Phosphoketolase n=1 Tax=Lasiodiplodia hormozganensis TaxID=869390 RepID=A0AA39YZ13_9PEZI|nr:putative phosphoketolase [Lasiodiplodia hormozganensis]
MVLSLDGSHPHSFSSQAFNAPFTPDRPIHFNYHSYRNEHTASLSSQPQISYVTIEAYREEGTTTAPFNMMLANDVSRYHVAHRALEGAEQRNRDVRLDFVRLHTDIQQYIYECGQDPPGIHDSPSFQGFTKGVGGGGGGVLTGRLVSTQPQLEDDDPDSELGMICDVVGFGLLPLPF